MIPSYNYAEYMPATLRSVLSQDPGPGEMQIEVVDDCSTAHDPEPMVRAVGGGRIAFHRQPRNVGMIANFNTCIRRAQGEWVHILHGDDLVRPGFYAHAREAVLAHADLGAWTCRSIYMDESGLWVGFSDLEARQPQVLGKDFVRRLLVDQRMQFVGTIVRRSMYEQLGGFRPELSLCLDWDMWKRVAVHAPIFFEPEPLACFRVHETSAHGKAVRAGRTVSDELRAIRMARAYAPPDQAARIEREAFKMAAIRAIRNARNEWRLGYRKPALRLLVHAVRCSVHPTVLARLARLSFQMLRYPAGRKIS